MKNRFIIKSADPSFESYYTTMRRRKAANISSTNFGQNGTLSQGGNVDPNYGFIMRKRPTARDGHSGIVVGETLYIFGGDRH
jgi:hypothetical protein